MKKRLLSFFLCVLMVITSVPVTGVMASEIEIKVSDVTFTEALKIMFTRGRKDNGDSIAYVGQRVEMNASSGLNHYAMLVGWDENGIFVFDANAGDVRGKIQYNRFVPYSELAEYYEIKLVENGALREYSSSEIKNRFIEIENLFMTFKEKLGKGNDKPAYFTTTGGSCGNNECEKCYAPNIIKAMRDKNLSLGKITENHKHSCWSCYGFCYFTACYIFGNDKTPEAEGMNKNNYIERLGSMIIQVDPTPDMSPEDYLTYCAEQLATHYAVAYPMNGGSITAWKLPWTDNSNSSLKLGTISGDVRIIRVIENHAGNIWYEYETGTGTRGFVYSGDLLFRAKTWVTLDPNGGSVSPNTIKVDKGYPYGDIPEGDLPKPTRSGYDFQGWYTAKSGGTKVTKSTIVTNGSDHTLYAHWKQSTVTPPYCTGVSHSSVTTDNASIKATWNNPSGIKLVKAGICVSTNSAIFDTGTKYTDNVPASYQTAATIPCSYNLKNEYGIKLSPGTTYYYAFFAIDSNDNWYTTEDDVRSFTTTATFPYHSGVSITNITADNAFIKATINNPSGLKLVKAGFYISTSPNAAETGTKYTDTVLSSYQTAATIPCTHDLKNEYGITLKSGTTYYIVLYAADSSGKEYPVARTEYKFTTTSVPVSSVSISPGNSTINIGSTLALKANISPSNATNKNVSWSSSNLAVASVSSDGVVTAKGKGTVTITATAKDGSGKTGKVTITVTCAHSSGYIIDPAVPATCTQKGLTEGKRCYACNEVIVKQTEVPSLGHNYSYKASKAPTTSATGTLTGTCSRCSGTTTVTLPKLNTTDYSYSVTKAATCTADGTARYTWKTTTYGKFYFDTTIGKSGHSYSAAVTKPTCTDQGYTTFTCSECGDSYVDSYVDATGHTDADRNGICDDCETPLTMGDLDLDGDVDAYDLTMLARHVGGIEYITGQALLNADVDGDGLVDAYDLTMHARYVGGIITDWNQK